MNAYEYLVDLQNSIGARLPGSQGETLAVAWLQDHCRALGLSPATESFAYQSDLSSARLRSVGLAYSIVVLTLLSRTLNPWLIVVGVGVTFVVFGPLWRRWERRAGRSEGHNVLAGVSRPWAEIVNRPAANIVFLCAHYDTAPSEPAWRRRLGNFDDLPAGFAFLGVIGLVTYSLAYGALLAFPATAALAESVRAFWQTVGVWLVLAAGLPGTALVTLAVLTRRSPAGSLDNPGADDNGSGVAVVLELASALRDGLATDVDVVAAFWAAEEAGLWGSEAFVEQHCRHLNPQTTLIVNVDTVGRGQCLMAVSGEGVLRRRAVDEALLQKWELACQNVGAATIREWLTPLAGSSDHAAWLNAGFSRALSVGRGNLVPISLPVHLLNRILVLPTGTQQTDIRHVHSPDDRLENIRPESLDETRRAIAKFLALQS